MKAEIRTIVTDLKGTEPKHSGKIGRVTTVIEGVSNGMINVDAFKGCGSTYERRKDAQITIYYGANLEFEGTLTELIQKLKS